MYEIAKHKVLPVIVVFMSIFFYPQGMVLAGDESSQRLKNLVEVSRETMQVLKRLHDELKNLKDNTEQVRETIGLLIKVQASTDAYMTHPENLGAGIIWANSTSKIFADIDNYTPELPSYIGKMVSGYLKAVPVYVNAITGILREHIKKIDTVSIKNEVSCERRICGEKVSCGNATFTREAVDVIRWVSEDMSDAKEIFRIACEENNFNRALAERGLMTGLGY